MIVNKKKIAILLATFQGDKYISEQLESILNQTNHEWKVFIHDDGSKDNTVEIIDRYCELYPDLFFRVKDDVSTGCAKKNFMHLTRIVESDYYMFCDQDDIWLDNKIEITFDRMKQFKDSKIPCLIHTELTVVDEKLNIIDGSMSHYQRLDCRKRSLSRALIQNVVTGCTMMINRSLRDEMLKPCDIDKVLMHDWWAALIANASGNISFINQPTIYYRQHLGNSVGAKKLLSFEYIKKTISNKEKIVNTLLDTQIQAGEFSRVYNNELSEIYSKVHTKNKFNRMACYINYKFYKSSLIRNIGLFLWG